MALEPFSFASLSKLDGGRMAAAVEHELRVCRLDCDDRPALEKARKVLVEITVVPASTDSRGNLDTVDLAYNVKPAVLPKRESRAYNMKATRGGLVFNELSPEAVDQMTLDMASKPKELPKENVDAG